MDVHDWCSGMTLIGMEDVPISDLGVLISGVVMYMDKCRYWCLGQLINVSCLLRCPYFRVS